MRHHTGSHSNDNHFTYLHRNESSSALLIPKQDVRDALAALTSSEGGVGSDGEDEDTQPTLIKKRKTSKPKQAQLDINAAFHGLKEGAALRRCVFL